MFNRPNVGLSVPKPSDLTETAYQASNKYGPKAWYKKAKAAIFMKKTNENDTESSSSPSSGQDEAVKK